MHAQEANVIVDSVAFGGAGVGRLPDGRVCFVPGTLPGEHALVRIVKSKKSYVEAELLRLTEMSLQRVQPPCPIFGQCGGCAYQHADYALQLTIKTSQVAELLRKVGGFSYAKVCPMLASPRQWEYRNRLSVHVENGRVGFYHRKTHRLIEASHCPIGSPPVNAQLNRLAANPPRTTKRITLRESTEQNGFTQVNDAAAQILFGVVREMLTGGGSLLVDAYCGSGFFAKRLRDLFEAIIGIDWSERGIQAALGSAGASEKYLMGSVEEHLGAALEGTFRETTALLIDPPAEGVSSDVISIIHEQKPATIVYVSCDPATLARDLKKLSSIYRLSYVQPVDMFPQTAEIEAVAKLEIIL